MGVEGSGMHCLWNSPGDSNPGVTGLWKARRATERQGAGGGSLDWRRVRGPETLTGPAHIPLWAASPSHAGGQHFQGLGKLAQLRPHPSIRSGDEAATLVPPPPRGDEDAPSMTPHQEWKPLSSFTLHSRPQLEGDTERAPLSHVSGLAGEVPTFSSCASV